MKPGIPWSVKGIEPEVREAAKHAARKAGMTLGEWLNTVILDQSDEEVAGNQAEPTKMRDDLMEVDRGHAPGHHDDTTVRLEDIASQLSQLALRERDAASIMPYEMPRPRPADSEALNRILNRIDSNERQAVEAFTAMHERLSVLGRQIAAVPKPVPYEKPEDVPGFASLEGAIRNVVEHIEISEKRTRDGLKSMQDRMAEFAQRAAAPVNAEDVLRTAPAFTSLEARIADMAARMQRSESLNQALPDLVRKEVNQLADRIEQVRKSSEASTAKAQSEAMGAAQKDLREIESRILGVLKETQSALGSQSATATDLHRVRGDMAALNRRIDELGASAAQERDVHALRVAIEQLSARVAQGPDMRPLADMDRRLGELNTRLEQNHAATRNLPQFGDLERRIAELDHRLADAVRLQDDGRAVASLEQHIGAFGERLAKTEHQLTNLGTIEQAIHQLYQGLEDNRTFATKVAEDAATRAAQRVMSAQPPQPVDHSPELQALRDGLQAVRESASHSDQRNLETLEAVHETLEQIVNKLAELETSAAGHQLAANMAQQAVPVAQASVEPQWAESAASPAPMPEFFDPAATFETPLFDPQPAPGAYRPEPEQRPAAQLHSPMPPPAMSVPDFASGGDTIADAGDDFIAAARRAAQAAATRSSVLSPENKPALKPGANSRFKLSLPFLKPKTPPPITYVGGRPVGEAKPTAPANGTRRKLILAAIVLLAAVSAVGFNLMARSTKPVKQSMVIETPVAPVVQRVSTPVQSVPQAAAAPQVVAAAETTDGLITSSLPARKTDATLTSLIAEPGTMAEAAEMPDINVGTLALREAAARGDSKAQFIVGSRYLDGIGVAQDLPKAAQWYQFAAANGLAPAQYRLATLFERGKGVPQDIATALLWYERAATGGNVKGMHNAAVIAAGNQAGAPNYDKAFRWFREAAERGLKDSQYNLAVLYERGLGVKIDRAEALLWYSLAGKQGDADAAKRANELSLAIPASEVATANAKLNGWQAKPTLDDANVVAITDTAWNDPAEPPPPVEDVSTLQPASPITQAQVLLTRLGFNVGEPDGQMGAKTQNAIRLFQLQSGMKVTGEITPDLLDAMRAKAG